MVVLSADLCVEHIQHLSDLLPLLQNMVEEAKITRRVFFLLETLQQLELPPETEEPVLVSVLQDFGSYLFCIVELCQILPGQLTGIISGNQFSKQLVYYFKQIYPSYSYHTANKAP